MREFKMFLFNVPVTLLGAFITYVTLSEGDIIASLFGALFLIAGILGIRSAFNSAKLNRRIFISGERYSAIITDYVEDGSMKIRDNGELNSLLAIRCRYKDNNGVPTEAIIPTGKAWSKRKDYPLNSSIEICVYDGEARLTNCEATLSNEEKRKLQNIDLESMNKDSGRRIMRAIKCPNCGATLMVANHGTAKCEYCDQLVSLDNDVLPEDDGYDVSMGAREIEKYNRKLTPEQIKKRKELVNKALDLYLNK